MPSFVGRQTQPTPARIAIRIDSRVPVGLYYVSMPSVSRTERVGLVNLGLHGLRDQSGAYIADGVVRVHSDVGYNFRPLTDR